MKTQLSSKDHTIEWLRNRLKARENELVAERNKNATLENKLVAERNKNATLENELNELQEQFDELKVEQLETAHDFIDSPLVSSNAQVKRERVKGGSGVICSPDLRLILDELVEVAHSYVIVHMKTLAEASNPEMRRKSVVRWGQVHKLLPHERWYCYLQKKQYSANDYAMIVVRQLSTVNMPGSNADREKQSVIDEYLLESFCAGFTPDVKKGEKEIAGRGVAFIDKECRDIAFAKDKDGDERRALILTNLDQALEHAVFVSLDTKHLCPVLGCNKSFTARKHLNEHYGNTHASLHNLAPMKWKCLHVDPNTQDECGKLFNSSKMRLDHINSTHKEPFKCPSCTYSSGQKSKVKRHMLSQIHTDTNGKQLYSEDQVNTYLNIVPRKGKTWVVSCLLDKPLLLICFSDILMDIIER